MYKEETDQKTSGARQWDQSDQARHGSYQHQKSILGQKVNVLGKEKGVRRE